MSSEFMHVKRWEDSDGEPLSVEQHTFTRSADATLQRVRDLYRTRGNEYLDSWGLGNIRSAFVDHILNVEVINGHEDEWKRLLILASMIDVKCSRLGGPWKQDTGDDLIAYVAVFTTLRGEYPV